MDSALPLLAAFYAGLAGSLHCVSMCGGIATLGGLGTARPTLNVVLFNGGRVASYAVAGALGAWLVALGVGFVPSPTARLLVALLTGAILAGLGLYFAFGVRAFRGVEALGGRFWQAIAPAVRRLLPIRHPLAALAAGAAWGWLPCGLVYMTLPLAWATGQPLTGALVMVVFGVGTAPAMVGLGLGGGGLRSALRRPSVRRWAGVTLVAFGVLMASSPWLFPHGRGGHGTDDGHRHAVRQGGEESDAVGPAVRYVCGDPDRLLDQLHGVDGGWPELDVRPQVAGRDAP